MINGAILFFGLVFSVVPSPGIFSAFTFACACLACLHDQNKCDFLEGRLLSGQSEQYQKFSKSTDWLEKGRPSKNATFVLIM